MKNPGPAKYLIKSCEEDSLINAFQAACDISKAIDSDHFVEIVDNQTGEKIAGFNKE